MQLLACQVPAAPYQPVIPVPTAPPAIQRAQDKLQEAGSQLLDKTQELVEKGKELILPKKPDGFALELPKVKLRSDPGQLLSLSSFQIPQTARFQADWLNREQSGSLIAYRWQIYQLGLPGIKEDELILESSGQDLNYTFEKSGRFRVRVTLETSSGVDSDTVLIWARE